MLSARARTVATIALGAALAVAAEWGPRVAEPAALWVPDLAVGLCFFVAGGLLTRDDTTRREGGLLALAGITWFLPNFEGAAVAALAWAASHGLAVHRAVLLHAVLASPTGRLRTRGMRVAVAIGYLAALSPAAGTPAAMVVGGLFVAAACWVTIPRPEPGSGRPRLVGSCYAAVLVASGLARADIAGQADGQLAPLLYDLGLVGVVLLLASAGRQAVADRRPHSGALLEIPLGPEESVRALLAESFGDPTIRVAYAVPGAAQARWVDELGRPVGAPETGDGRSRVVELDGRPVAVVRSERPGGSAPDLEPSAAAVATFASRHVLLRARLREDAAALDASRRRLLAADDDARLGFSLELAGGASASLLQVRESIAPLAGSDVPVAVAGCLAAATEQLDLATTELRRFAVGLGPVALADGGLDAALRSIADSGPIPVALDLQVADLPHDLAVGAYFVCAEAITNAWRHADAGSVAVTVRQAADVLRLLVVDDGRGGVGLDGGSGVRRLQDRVDAMGGVLAVDSPPGGGTRVAIELPLGVPGAPAPGGPVSR